MSTIKVLLGYTLSALTSSHVFVGFFMQSLHVGAILTIHFSKVPQAYVYSINYIPLPTNIFCLIKLKFIYSLREIRFLNLKRIYSIIPGRILKITEIKLNFKTKELWRQFSAHGSDPVKYTVPKYKHHFKLSVPPRTGLSLFFPSRQLSASSIQAMSMEGNCCPQSLPVLRASGPPCSRTQ